ncbi:hypothetical protein R9B83_01930 [Metamycoplasma equirhinis]|uniref:Lipoprotein n=1 Tax=Metamycoplasma equirhinis TaxID=92402 RepID=A0ABZ0PAW0_9BACT|nr:hypothetical protein [Metamycoplasma equirhinis]TPD98753.1 hypothetical protein FJM08_01680 [Metamycoplasma equirhinis]WPB53729.1 hypothetical protein R9B83_01930 [Metamycoplasma equirhinis]
MKKNHISASILGLAPIVILTPILIACTHKKQAVFLDISKISRVFLNRLSIGQIASLHNSEKIFYSYDKKNQKIYFDLAFVKDNKFYLKNASETLEYKFDFPVRTTWKQSLSEYNNINIENSTEESDINDFLNEYTFDEIDSANDLNDEWFSVLSEKNKHDYNREGDPYFADLQTIIFRVIQDIESNYSTMNQHYMNNAKKYNSKRIIFNDIFETQYIQAKSWLSPEHKRQRELFENILVLYLNKFNVKVKKIIIDWQDTEIKTSYSGATDYIAFKIKDILNWDNQSIMNESKKNIKYYINKFRNYSTTQKFGVGETLKINLPLFTDYVSNPLLFIDGKKYINVVDNINYFISGATSFDFWNAKGLMYFFQTFKNEIFYLVIPESKKASDKEYKIIDFKYTKYFNTNQLLEAIVRVYKKDGSFKDYSLISSNFDDHGHRLKGMIFNNVKEKDVRVQDIFSFNVKKEDSPEGIKLNDFLQKDDETSAFRTLLEKAGKQLENLFSYWENNSKSNFEAAKLDTDSFQVKVLASYINNYLLAYALENEAQKIHSGVKRIDVSVIKDNNQLGRIYLKLDFVSFANENDLSFKSEGEQKLKSVYLYWNGFKGYSGNLKNIFTIDKIEDK